jgi:predicted MFS family arabinose efflux permease
VLAQFCGTSLWFAGNAVVTSLEEAFHWPSGSAGHVTTAVQAGFITGTLLVTLIGLSDRMSPSRLFFFSCCVGAICNSIPVVSIESFPITITSRFLTGICLGGIYPVGMKIAADWREQGLGDWLGALVGALVLGTALPHALKSFDTISHPEILLPVISAIAFLGGLILLILVPDGPFRKQSVRFRLADITHVLRIPGFRAPLLGYFGHMWELYTFWALVPWIISRYLSHWQENLEKMSLLSFAVIGIGGIGCWAGGRLSLRSGSLRVARTALFLSAMCCILSPFMWHLPFSLFLILLLLWGLTVVPDSPQFSALVATHAPADIRGTSLTFATCIGFAITIVSIQTVHAASAVIPHDYLLWLLAPGPIAGLLATSKK